MTIITIDNTALMDLLKPIIMIMLAFLIGYLIAATVWMMTKMAIETHDSRIRRENLEKAKQLYTARKRQFEGNEKGWKKWRDANYKIINLVKGDN